LIDLSDILVIVGVLLLGASITYLAGMPGLVGFGGGVLLVVGLALAWRQGRRPAR